MKYDKCRDPDENQDQVSAWDEEAKGIKAKLKKRNKLYKLSRVLLAVDWHVWQERNRRIFKINQHPKSWSLEDL